MHGFPKALVAVLLPLCFIVVITAAAVTPVAAAADQSDPLYLPLVLAAGEPVRPDVRINEFMADNDGIVADEQGEYDDVIELYNPGPGPVNLGGMYLSDDLTDPTKFRIEEGVAVPSLGYLLFWADSSPEQGPLHAGFALSKGGESIGLFDVDANGNALLDSYTFGPQTTDVSEGRCPDGGSAWIFFPTPTMGAANEPCGSPPSIAGVSHQPAYPQADEPVTVTVAITATGASVTATLWYSAEADFVAVPMPPLGGGAYQASIPGRPDDAWVRYYVEAQDAAGRTQTDPAGAPASAYGYVAGFTQPDLAVNELMADNASTLQDPDEPPGPEAQYPDWIELHNYGPQPLDLGGYSLTDDPNEPAQYLIPQGVVIPAGEFLVFYADDEPEQGPLHTNFKLGSGGETLGLYAAGGRVKIDEVTFPAQEPDFAYGRSPDGIGAWEVRPKPTPGESNAANLTAFNAWLPLANVTAQPPSLPLRIDSGGGASYTAVNGILYQPDRAYGPGSYYGYLGGYENQPVEWWESYPLGGTEDQLLYKTQRLGWQEYRAGQIPNGDYLLTLRFAEQVVHGPDLCVMDLAAEGQSLAANFDVYAHAGRRYALNRRFAVTVSDGELNLTAIPLAGETHLAALELAPRLADATAPAAPAGLAAMPSYNSVLLDWAGNTEDDLASYYVYRASQPRGPYTRLQTEPVYISRAQDNLPDAHILYYYRVTAVDVYGSESAQSDYKAAAAISPADAALPLYQLEVSTQNLARLNADPSVDIRTPATFTWQGGTVPVEVRYRGSASRVFDKKSWKVVFSEGDSPFPNHDRININANWQDFSLIRSKLANDLYVAAGLRPPHAEHVLLMLNGDYRGVYTRNEQMDEGFLLSSGRNPRASIYKVDGRFMQLLPNEAAYRVYYEKETNTHLSYDDLIQFVEFVNRAPDDVFAAQIAQTLDVDSFLAYYALIVLTSNFDSAAHNVYLIHDHDTGLWELTPWDLDATFSQVDAAIDIGGINAPDASGAGNILRTRMLAVPQYRAAYCRLLNEYMDTIFSDAVLHPQVDALYARVLQDGLRDWRKLGWESNSAFRAAQGYIKSFITARKAYLRGEMQTFCPQP